MKQSASFPKNREGKIIRRASSSAGEGILITWLKDAYIFPLNDSLIGRSSGLTGPFEFLHTPVVRNDV